ncbi:MAG: hypothetical protein JW703_00670 [Candidatus Diapherotrites archaeon]|nr:hypothetical protein [Candidatus Diapherotrites archaeon]
MNKELSSEAQEHLFAPGHSACPGCGPAITLRAVLDVLGEDVIVVNATGCMEIVSSKYPLSAWRVPYIHCVFENAASVAAGIAGALEAQGNTHTKVIVIAGDGACYSPDTKVLTFEGFKWVSEIKKGDKIWSVNPKTFELELQKATKLHEYYYEGNMITAKTRYVNFCVTPNHSVPVLLRDSNKMKIIEARELLTRYKTLLPRSFKWKGIKKEFFYLPEVENKTNKKQLPKFKMKDWIEFIGWFVTEGSAYYNKSCGYLTRIYQSKKENRKRILALTKRMGLHSVECNRSVDISSKQLYIYLKENCGAYFYEKRIPKELLKLNPELLKILFDALIAGDGSKAKPGKGRTAFRTTFITKSNYLKDQFIELSLKLGKNCSLNFSDDGVARIGVEEKHVKNELYSSRVFLGNKPQVFEENYSGMVYCPELPKNHTLIIERNGKISLNGNSYDIGFGAVSGAADRNDNILYICYDNEHYANTGVQQSGATPFGANTTTSPDGDVIHGKIHERKPIVEVMAAHGIIYSASASIAFIPDLHKKLLKAKEMNGFRFITVHAPCALGAGFDGSQTIDLSKKAVESGLWFLFEFENEKYSLNFNPKELTSPEHYLKAQKRFKHLNEKQIEHIKKMAEKNLNKIRKLCGEC